jgi:hypothetical protein
LRRATMRSRAPPWSRCRCDQSTNTHTTITLRVVWGVCDMDVGGCCVPAARVPEATGVPPQKRGLRGEAGAGAALQHGGGGGPGNYNTFKATVCLPLDYSGNPGVNRRVLQGWWRRPRRACGARWRAGTPFDIGCLPLSCSGNPGGNGRISQGLVCHQARQGAAAGRQQHPADCPAQGRRQADGGRALHPGN